MSRLREIGMVKQHTWVKSMVAGVALGACLIGTAPPASADINLGGYTGPVTIKYLDFESIFRPSTGQLSTNTSPLTPQNGDVLVGVFSVTSILPTGSIVPLWSAGAPGDGFLVGTFTGPTLENVSSTGFNATSPWNFNLYSSNTAADFTQGIGGLTAGGCTGAPSFGCYNGINQPGSTNVLQLDIQTALGINASPTIFSNGTFFSSAQTSGSNFYDANVIAGAAFNQFNTNGVPNLFGFPNTDFNVNSDFCAQAVGSSCNGGVVVGNWEFSSQDPVTGNVVAVPEPGSLALLGGGLIGLAGFAWRRRKSPKAQA